MRLRIQNPILAKRIQKKSIEKYKDGTSLEVSRVHSVIPRDSQRISFQADFNLKNSSMCSASVEQFGTPSIHLSKVVKSNTFHFQTFPNTSHLSI